LFIYIDRGRYLKVGGAHHGTRAYNGVWALGAEPPAGSRGKGPGQEIRKYLGFGRSMKAANLLTYLKFGNTENHRYLETTDICMPS